MTLTAQQLRAFDGYLDWILRTATSRGSCRSKTAGWSNMRASVVVQKSASLFASSRKCGLLNQSHTRSISC